MKMLKGLFKSIIRFYTSPPKGSTPLEQQLWYLRRNIKDGEEKLEEMYRIWRDDNGVCCPACMFGSKYNVIADKQERRRHWEQVLMKRQEQRRNKVVWEEDDF